MRRWHTFQMVAILASSRFYDRQEEKKNTFNIMDVLGMSPMVIPMTFNQTNEILNSHFLTFFSQIFISISNKFKGSS